MMPFRHLDKPITVRRERLAIGLLTATCLLLATAYRSEHQRAEMGVRYYKTLCVVRGQLETAEQERNALKNENQHLKEKAVIWWFLADLRRSTSWCNSTLQVEQLANKKYPVSVAESRSVAHAIFDLK